MSRIKFPSLIVLVMAAFIAATMNSGSLSTASAESGLPPDHPWPSGRGTSTNFTQPGSPPDITLMVSTNQDRSNPVPLEGSSLSGEVYIFAETSDDSAIRFVKYKWEGTGWRQSEGTRRTRRAPWDLYSSYYSPPTGLKVWHWGDGQYTLTAVANLRDGGSVTEAVNFTIAQEYPTEVEVKVSRSEDLSNSVPLDIGNLDGDVYIWMDAESPRAVKFIYYYLDREPGVDWPTTSARGDKFHYKRYYNPWINETVTKPLRSDYLSPGNHSVKVVVHYRNGVVRLLDNNFNAGSTTCNPDPDWDLNAEILGDGTTASIHNASNLCSYDVGYASYEKFDDVIDNQELFDSAAGVVGPGQTVELPIGLPDCSFRSTLFHGDLLTSLAGVRYGDRLLDSLEAGGAFCIGNEPLEADIELVSMRFGDLPAGFAIGERFDVPVVQVIRNNGPADANEIEVQLELDADGLSQSFEVTQALLDITDGSVAVGVVGGAVATVTAPERIFSPNGDNIRVRFVTALASGEEITLEELFGVTSFSTDIQHLSVSKQVTGLNVIDNAPGNNAGSTDAEIGPKIADVGVITVDTDAPTQVETDVPFVITQEEEVTNFGPAGPVHVVANQFLLPPADCLVGAVITQDALDRVGGTISIEVNGVVTEYSAPITVFPQAIGDSVGFIFGIDLEVGEVVPVLGQWTVECENPSHHDFRVERSLTAEGIDDPTPQNNSSATDLMIPVFGIADLEVVAVEFGDLPAAVVAGDVVDVPLDVVIRNNGPDGPVEMGVMTGFLPAGFEVSFDVTQELLDLSGGALFVSFINPLTGFDAVLISTPQTFFLGADGGSIGLIISLNLTSGEAVTIPHLFTVTFTQDGPHDLLAQAVINGIHVNDPVPANDSLIGSTTI